MLTCEKRRTSLSIIFFCFFFCTTICKEEFFVKKKEKYAKYFLGESQKVISRNSIVAIVEDFARQWAAELNYSNDIEDNNRWHEDFGLSNID